MSRTKLVPASDRELMLVCNAVFACLSGKVKTVTYGDSTGEFDAYFVWKNGWNSKVTIRYQTTTGGLGEKAVGVDVVSTRGTQVQGFEADNLMVAVDEMLHIANMR